MLELNGRRLDRSRFLLKRFAPMALRSLSGFPIFSDLVRPSKRCVMDRVLRASMVAREQVQWDVQSRSTWSKSAGSIEAMSWAECGRSTASMADASQALGGQLRAWSAWPAVLIHWGHSRCCRDGDRQTRFRKRKPANFKHWASWWRTGGAEPQRGGVAHPRAAMAPMADDSSNQSIQN